MVTQDPKLHVSVRWEREMPAQIAEVIASLGEPTSGACWMHCAWDKTRTINWTSFHWSAPD